MLKFGKEHIPLFLQTPALSGWPLVWGRIVGLPEHFIGIGFSLMDHQQKIMLGCQSTFIRDMLNSPFDFWQQWRHVSILVTLSLSHCFSSKLKANELFMFDTEAFSTPLSQIWVSSCYFISSHPILSEVRNKLLYQKDLELIPSVCYRCNVSE